MIGITIEWNVIRRSRNAIPSTNANTIGVRTDISELKSCEPAVSPVTDTSAPLTRSSVVGISELRSVESACSDAAFSPSPASGAVIFATVWSGFTVTSIGFPISPVASAFFSNAAIADLASGEVTSFAWNAITAGAGPPGNFCSICL